MKNKKHKKILSVAIKTIIIIILLETVLYLSGNLYKIKQKNSNNIHDDESYRILAIGDSLTYGGDNPWPNQLEEILNNRSAGKKYRVIGAGLPGGNSEKILSILDNELDEYEPDMVITMMGIIDPEPRPKIISIIMKTKTCTSGRYLAGKAGENLISLLNPSRGSEEWYINKGRKHASMGEDELAEEAFITARNINPENRNVYFELYVLYSKSGNKAGMEEAMKTLIEIYPEDRLAYENLVSLYFREQKYDLVENITKKMIELDPKDPLAYQDMVWLNIKKKDYGAAEEYSKKALECSWNKNQTYVYMMILYDKQGKKEEMEEAYAHLKELVPAQNTRKNFVIPVFYHLELDEYMDGEMIGLINLTPEEEKLSRVFRPIYNESFISDEAVASIKEYIMARPSDPRGYEFLKKQYEHNNKTEQDIEVIKKAIEFFPEEDFYYGLARKRYEEMGKESEGIALFSSIMQKYPRYFGPYNELSEMYSREGKTKEITAKIEDYLKNHKRDEEGINVKMQILLAKNYIREGRTEEFEQMAEKMGKKDKASEVNLLREVAAWLKEEGRLEESKAMFEKVKDIKEGNMKTTTKENYVLLSEKVKGRGIRLAVMQYPTLEVEDLVSYVGEDDSILFISNEDYFNEAVKNMGYDKLFIDRKHGTFGHCTDLGNRMIAENAADAILNQE